MSEIAFIIVLYIGVYGAAPNVICYVFGGGKVKRFIFTLFICAQTVTKLFCSCSLSLQLIEPLNYFETHYWRFRQTYFFENN